MKHGSIEKTNALRLLDAANIAYAVHTYDPECVDGQEVASLLHEDPDRVFKTLVCENQAHAHFVFVVPVNATLDLKKAAKVSQSKSIALIPYKELLPLTGYVHGGCSPIGLKKPFPVYIEETAQLFDAIFVSAGRRGYQVELSPSDLSAMVNATFVPLT